MLNVNFFFVRVSSTVIFWSEFLSFNFLGPFRPEREWLYWISQQMCVILALGNKRHALGFWQAWKWYLHWLNYHRCLPGIHYSRLKLLHLSSAIWPISCFSSSISVPLLPYRMARIWKSKSNWNLSFFKPFSFMV